jgi:hypothetical protein
VKQGLNLRRKAGLSFNLDASANDPDGDRLSYRWWQYTEADTFDGTVTIADPDRASTRFTIPATASKNSTVHLILEVTDNGRPALKHYQRVVVTVT